MDIDLSSRIAGHTCRASNDRKSNISGSIVNQEQKHALVNVFDVLPEDSPMFDEQTIKAQHVLKESMQPHCYVWTVAFDIGVDVHQEATPEDLREAFDLVLTYSM